MKDWMRSKIRKPWKRIKGLASVPSSNSKKAKKKRRRQRKNKMKNERAMAEKRCLEFLGIFWKEFAATETFVERFFLVKSAIQKDWWVSKELRVQLRREYNKKRWYLLQVPIEYCALCESAAPQEKHHIVMLAFGGINSDLNLIAICMDCHDAIHPWMSRQGEPELPEPPDHEEPPDGPEEPPEKAWNLGKYRASGYDIEAVEQEEFYR